jgi:diguanylate cyclase (GGDEF)-like protein
MTGGADPGAATIELAGCAVDVLMPMHLWFGAAGQVMRVGPTLAKVAGKTDLRGQPLFDVIDILRPSVPQGLSPLLALKGKRLRLALKSRPDLPFRGVLVPMPAGQGGFISLSLGVSFARAVADCDLTLNDFSPCDQTIDLLYLREANAAIAHESRNLTARLQLARQNAEEQALTDALTGLQNRRAMDATLKELTAEPMARFGLMHLDLDFFKEVNDTFGHAAGDHVLTHVANILRDEIRKGDIVARVGGDEFLLLFRDCDDADLLQSIADRLIARLEEPTTFDGQSCRISASAGSVLASRYEEPNPDQMLNDADIALYTSKNRGRAQHTYFDDELLAPVIGTARPN